MHRFNQSFNTNQSVAHSKGVQITYLAIINSPLGFVGLPGVCWALRPRHLGGAAGAAYQSEDLGEGTCCGATVPRDGWGASAVAPARGGCSGLGVAGARRCHFGGDKGGCWPADTGPGGGLGGTLLGRWAEPATHGCGGLATSGGGSLANPPILTTCPCPAVPFNACSWPLASHGCCCSLAAHGCPSSHPATC